MTLRRHRRFRRRTVRVIVEYPSGAGWCRDTATTLGAGGLFVETETPLPPGAHLKLRFQLEGGAHEHELEGRVVWSRGPDDPGAHPPGMGIEFTDAAGRARLATDLEASGDEPPR